MPKIGLGGLPRPLSLHSVARRCSARPGGEAALSVLERAAASTACISEKASFRLPPDTVSTVQVSLETASVQSDASVPNPATHRSRMEYTSHERRLTKVQIAKDFIQSSPRDRTDGEGLQTASKI